MNEYTRSVAAKLNKQLDKCLNNSVFRDPGPHIKVKPALVGYNEQIYVLKNDVSILTQLVYRLGCLEKRRKYPARSFFPYDEVVNKRTADERDLFSTKTKWLDTGYISSSTYEPYFSHLCIYCRRPPMKKRFVYSDSRYDTQIDVCDCKGARKHGTPFKDIKDD